MNFILNNMINLHKTTLDNKTQQLLNIYSLH